MSRGFWTSLTEIMSKWCGMFWRSTTKVFILNKEESLLASLGRHYSFRTSATFFCFFCPFFYGTIFFAVEELSSVHGSKCMWTLVPRSRRYIIVPNPFWNSTFFLICIRFDKWSGMYYKKNLRRAAKRVDLHYKGFKCEFIKGLAQLPIYHHRQRRRRRLAHSHSHSSRWDSNSAANAATAAASAGCKQPPPPPASSY